MCNLKGFGAPAAQVPFWVSFVSGGPAVPITQFYSLQTVRAPYPHNAVLQSVDCKRGFAFLQSVDCKRCFAFLQSVDCKTGTDEAGPEQPPRPAPDQEATQ